MQGADVRCDDEVGGRELGVAQRRVGHGRGPHHGLRQGDAGGILLRPRLADADRDHRAPGEFARLRDGDVGHGAPIGEVPATERVGWHDGGNGARRGDRGSQGAVSERDRLAGLEVGRHRGEPGRQRLDRHVGEQEREAILELGVRDHAGAIERESHQGAAPDAVGEKEERVVAGGDGSA